MNDSVTVERARIIAWAAALQNTTRAMNDNLAGWKEAAHVIERQRRALRWGIAAVLFLTGALIYTAVRHAAAMDECYIPGESIQLEADHRPATITASLVHYKHRKRWHV